MEILREVYLSLLSPTYYGTAPLASPRTKNLFSQNINFSVIDEFLAIQQCVIDYQRRKRNEQIAYGIGAGILGALFGMRDGFHTNDLILGAAIGLTASNIYS